MTDVLDLYDHEVKAVLQLQERLNDRIRTRRVNYNDFEREIREEFAALGLTVNVNWYEFALDGVKQEGAMPEITITGRTDTAFRFDKDRQVHEVTNDVLEMGEGGVIKTDPDTLKRFTGGGSGHDHQH